MAGVPQDDLPARIRAAIAYAGAGKLTARRLADELRMSPGQISHYAAGTKPIPASRQKPLIDTAAELSGLPPSFFYADFTRLDEIAQDEGAEEFIEATRAATLPPGVPRDRRARSGRRVDDRR